MGSVGFHPCNISPAQIFTLRVFSLSCGYSAPSIYTKDANGLVFLLFSLPPKLSRTVGPQPKRRKRNHRKMCQIFIICSHPTAGGVNWEHKNRQWNINSAALFNYHVFFLIKVCYVIIMNIIYNEEGDCCENNHNRLHYVLVLSLNPFNDSSELHDHT